MTTRLERIRRHLGWTQAEMAEQIGLSLRAYTDIERGVSAEKETHVKAAEMVQLVETGSRDLPLDLAEVGQALLAAADTAKALPYAVTFSIEAVGDPPTAVLMARGHLEIATTESDNAVTGRPLAAVLTDPDRELKHIFGFLDATLGARLRGAA